MASYPPAGSLPCYKVGTLPPAGSAASTAASTATGYSSSGSTLGSEVCTPRPEEPFYYYQNYAAWQASANGWDDASKHAKASAESDDSVSVPALKKASCRGHKQPTDVCGTSRRHWILPPPARSRSPEEAEPSPASPKRSSQPGKLKGQSAAFTRHWMLDKPKCLEQDTAAEAAGAAKTEQSYFPSSLLSNLYNFMPLGRVLASVKEEDCVGQWSYPRSSYTVSRMADGLLYFEHAKPNGGTIRGQLAPVGQWLEGEVYANRTEHVGTIRLRPGDAARTLISNFRAAPKISGSACDGFGVFVAGKADWGEDVVATKEERRAAAPAVPQRPEAEPGQHRWPLSAGSLEPRHAVAHCSTPFSCHGLDCGESTPSVEVPVRNTFIQFDEPKPLVTLPRSSPAILINGPFNVKPKVMEQAHTSGNCRPCAYFWGKTDGCRGGDSCKFCHLCQPGELKRRRREKDKMLRAQQRAARTTPAVRHAPSVVSA